LAFAGAMVDGVKTMALTMVAQSPMRY
jgi:hypothetical protein